MTKKNKIVADEQLNDINKSIEEMISDVEPTIEEVIEKEISEDYGENNETLYEETFEEVLPAEVTVIDEQVNIKKPVEIVKSKRSVDSLSKDEYRTYLRTGRIPE